MLQQLMYLAITIMLPVVVKYFTDLLRAKTAQTKYSQIIDIVANAVEETNQTYVDALKAAGKFDEVAQSEAMELSLTTAIDCLSDDLIKYINETQETIEEYITTLIESYIKKGKE